MQDRETVEKDVVSSRGKQVTALVLLNLFLIVVSPFIFLKKLDRSLRKRVRNELDWNRWAVTDFCPEVSFRDNKSPRVVLVGAAFGELRMIEAATRLIEKERPDASVIWCLRDVPTIRFVRKTQPGRVVVVWPFDNAFPVMKWARRVRPDVLVLVEKIWLPSLIGISRLSGSRVAVVNGRVSDKHQKSKVIKRAYDKWILDNIDVFCFQSKQLMDRLTPLLRSGTTALTTGNMKLDLETPPLDPSRVAEIEKWLATRGDIPLLIAGSTAADGDEDFVYAAFEKVRAKVPCCLLVAPRQLSRAQETLTRAVERGYAMSPRSAPTEQPADVYVLDTLGELAHVYQYAEGAFVGGTIHGAGHNVIEPVAWGIPVSYGPQRGNFEDLQLLCEKFGVGFRCLTPEDLAAHWISVLTDAELRSKVRGQAEALLANEKGAVHKTALAILPLIPKST